MQAQQRQAALAQAREFVRTQRDKGIADDETRQKLKKSGWGASALDELWELLDASEREASPASVEGPLPTSQPATPVAAQQHETTEVGGPTVEHELLAIYVQSLPRRKLAAALEQVAAKHGVATSDLFDLAAQHPDVRCDYKWLGCLDKNRTKALKRTDRSLRPIFSFHRQLCESEMSVEGLYGKTETLTSGEPPDVRTKLGTWCVGDFLMWRALIHLGVADLQKIVYRIIETERGIPGTKPSAEHLCWRLGAQQAVSSMEKARRRWFPAFPDEGEPLCELIVRKADEIRSVSRGIARGFGDDYIETTDMLPGDGIKLRIHPWRMAIARSTLTCGRFRSWIDEIPETTFLMQRLRGVYALR